MMDNPDEDDPLNISIPNDPFNFKTPVMNKSYFAKSNAIVYKWIFQCQHIQWNKIQYAQPGYKPIDLSNKKLMGLIQYTIGSIVAIMYCFWEFISWQESLFPKCMCLQFSSACFWMPHIKWTNIKHVWTHSTT